MDIGIYKRIGHSLPPLGLFASLRFFLLGRIQRLNSAAHFGPPLRRPISFGSRAVLSFGPRDGRRCGLGVGFQQGNDLVQLGSFGFCNR